MHKVDSTEFPELTFQLTRHPSLENMVTLSSTGVSLSHVRNCRIFNTAIPEDCSCGYNWLVECLQWSAKYDPVPKPNDFIPDYYWHEFESFWARRHNKKPATLIR